jgi:hypothetical protein
MAYQPLGIATMAGSINHVFLKIKIKKSNLILNLKNPSQVTGCLKNWSFCFFRFNKSWSEYIVFNVNTFKTGLGP